MPSAKLKGFGLIGLIITIAIIMILIFGYTKFNHGQSEQNQIEQGNADIKAAQNAANQENSDNRSLQNQVQGLQPDLSPNTYHNIENRAKSVSQ